MNKRVCLLVLGCAALLSGCGASPEKTGGQPRPMTTASGIEIVAVPAGSFEMGSANQDEPDQRLHRVQVSAFSIDKYPVTQEVYEKLTGKNPSLWQGPRNPVEQIRWRDAAAFCNARSRAEGLQPAYNTNTWACDFDADGYRLPTEAEYEYALRAGLRRADDWFGDSAQELKRHAWFKGNSPRGTHPVGEKPPNNWGLCDMVGNVWEWCNDWYQQDYYQHSPAQDPRRTRAARPPARTAWSGAAAGTRNPTTAARPTAIMKCPPTPTPASPRTSTARSASVASGNGPPCGRPAA